LRKVVRDYHDAHIGWKVSKQSHLRRIHGDTSGTAQFLYSKYKVPFGAWLMKLINTIIAIVYRQFQAFPRHTWAVFVTRSSKDSFNRFGEEHQD
jgi:hypothetical protein